MTTANQKAIEACCEWMVKIANNNDFHYGRSKWAHRYGCYFCGTQGDKVKHGASKSQAAKSYCCNPFAVAGWVHGAGVDTKCAKGGLTIPLAGGSTTSLKKHNFKKVSKPSSYKDLHRGDILLTKTHCMVYLGDGKIVHAAHHDNGKRNAYWNDSIKVSAIGDQWGRTKEVWRYYGNGKFEDDKYPVYEKGKTYILKANMHVRIGYPKDGELQPLVSFDKLTANAQKHADANGVLQKGTEVTVRDFYILSDTCCWISTPSGWMCGYDGDDIYVDEDNAA